MIIMFIDITIPPRDVNISINEVAEFNCTGVANGINWNKNGQPMSNSDEGVNILPTILNAKQNIRMSTLRMKVTLTDNAANITCKAYILVPLSEESSTALLLVQGIDYIAKISVMCSSSISCRSVETSS